MSHAATDSRKTDSASPALDSMRLLSLPDSDFDDVALGLLSAHDFALVRRVGGKCVIQHQPDGEIITLKEDETVEGVFRFAGFVDAVKG